jgi:hypothetical protein
MNPKSFQKLINRLGTYVGVLVIILAWLLLSWKLSIVLLLVFISTALTFYKETTVELPARNKPTKTKV